ELEVQSYSWGAGLGAPPVGGGGGGSKPLVDDFMLTLAPMSVEPGLWGHLANGGPLSAVVHLRDASGREYQTYTLSNVTVSSFSTGASEGSVRADTIALRFGTVAESATAPAGPANSAQYNVTTNVIGGAGTGGIGSLAGPALPQPPQLGVAFVE